MKKNIYPKTGIDFYYETLITTPGEYVTADMLTSCIIPNAISKNKMLADMVAKM